MIGTEPESERGLRTQAIADAGELFAHHGDAAVAMLTAKINDPATGAVDRRRHRLTRMEVERLGRERRRTPMPNAMVVWQTPRFGLAGLLALFGWRRSAGRRRR